MSERVVTVYVCARKHHRLAEVVARAEGYVVRLRRVPVADIGAEPASVRHRSFSADEEMPLRGEPFWSTEVACCGREYVLTQAGAEQDVSSGVERVVLDAKR